MPGHTLVVVSDAHLGVTPPAVEEALLAFLDAVPTLGDCLLLNGDLSEVWFSDSRVVPRRGFPVAATLATLARQPYGPTLLGVVAAGLLAYGAYAIVESRYRRMSVR